MFWDKKNNKKGKKGGKEEVVDEEYYEKVGNAAGAPPTPPPPSREFAVYMYNGSGVFRGGATSIWYARKRARGPLRDVNFAFDIYIYIFK